MDKLCGAAETAYPCGAVSAETYDLTRMATARPTRVARPCTSRSQDRPHGCGSMQMLRRCWTCTRSGCDEIPAQGDGFRVAYGVAPLMCFVAAPDPDSAPAPSAARGNRPGAATAADRDIRQRRQDAGRGARTTLTQTVGRFRWRTPMRKPPITASGTVDITGGLQVVTNPNAGGPGVPVSVWTRKNVVKTGTTNTCYADEFFRFGAQNNAPPTFEGTVNKTIVCDTCQCNGDKSLSYDKSGNLQDEGDRHPGCRRQLRQQRHGHQLQRPQRFAVLSHLRIPARSVRSRIRNRNLAGQ